MPPGSQAGPADWFVREKLGLALSDEVLAKGVAALTRVIEEGAEPERSEQAKAETKGQAYDLLLDLVPRLLFKIAGRPRCEGTVLCFLAALGVPRLNRLLVFELLDVMLMHLVPELLPRADEEPRAEVSALWSRF